MYDVEAVQFAALRGGYRTYIAAMFALLGASPAEADRRAAAVYALEAKIAATHWTRVQNRDPQKTYNKVTTVEIAALAPAIDWKPWLAAVGLAGQARINVRPVMLRVATVRNRDAWYEAFKPRAGDALFLPPDQRVRIW